MAKKKVDLVSLLTQRVAMDNMAEMRREIIGLSLSRKCLIYIITAIITAFSPLGQDIFFLFRGFSPILMNYKTYHLNMANYERCKEINRGGKGKGIIPIELPDLQLR